MASCAVEGGCASDYFAILVSAIFFLMLLSRLIYPYAVHRVDRSKGSGFWIPTIQVLASFNLLLSIMLSVDFLKFKKRHWWQSCILWAVWIEGPLGFGLLLSCRVTQTFQLYFIFVKRCLPPIRSFIFLPLILVPWIAGATFMHIRKPFNDRCHMGIHWIIPTISLHALYVIALIGFTGAVRHVEFRFDELRDLWRGILVSTFTVGVWVGAYILNETHDNILWLQVASRFLLLVTAGILIITLFSISSSQPLLSQISIRNRDPLEFDTMGKALGISESGLLLRREPIVAISPSEPLNKLLEDKRFRYSFMAFADSCLAGESVHFYDEVRELDKIPVDDPIRRIYMARHVIEKYIKAGSTMEVNISHRTRQEILTTSNLVEPRLFSSALNELIQLMKMNLAKDYWSSMFFVKLRDEMRSVVRPSERDLDPMTSFKSSPRISSVHGSDDPFHQENHSSENSIG